MIQGTENLRLGDLISRRVPFTVPKYQRAFAWDDEISDFIRDLRELYLERVKGAPNAKRHFFGGLVSVNQIAPGTATGRVYDVVDGQQRLATFILTIALLIKGLRDLASQAKDASDLITATGSESHADTTRDDYLEYKEVVSGGVQQRLRLTLSRADQSFFEDVIKGANLQPARESHRRLQNAWTRIGKELIDPILYEANLPPSVKLEKLLCLRSCVTEDCYLIHIVSDDRNEAYQLFSVLNDRGKTLSDGDLLRSYTMELLENHQSLQMRIEQSWDEILSYSESQIEDFLRTYYASHQGERAPKRDLADSFYQRFFGYPHRPFDMSQIQSASVVKDRIEGMQRERRVFSELSEGSWPYEESVVSPWERDRLLRLVKVLRHSLCFPLLLSCKECLMEKDFYRMISLLERLVFRYIYIIGGHPGKLSDIYYAHAIRIRENPANYKIEHLEKDLLDFQMKEASDALFEANLGLRLAYNRSAARVIKHFLTTIEDHLKWFNNGAPGRPKPDLTKIFDLEQISIEHVYPQNPATPVPALDHLKQDIGNLTFWAPNDNRAAGNVSFVAKKDRYKDSMILLTQEISSLSVWNVNAVMARRSRLVEIAKKVFTV
jgi:hypothetical protein